MTEDDDDNDDELGDDEEEGVGEDDLEMVEEVEDGLDVELDRLITVVGGNGSFVGMRKAVDHQNGRWLEMKRIQRVMGPTCSGGGSRAEWERVPGEPLTTLHHPSVSIHGGSGEMSVEMQTRKRVGGRESESRRG